MGRRARVTREEVLSAARDAFSERGFDGTTLSAIASRLSVSPAALLRHAPTKEALFGAAMASSDLPLPLPIEFVRELKGTEDPLRVLRRIAERLIPILEATFAESVVHWFHSRKVEAGPVTIALPFDPRRKSTPPMQAFRVIEGYLKKAVEAGTLELPDVRAAAASFQGTLFAYVSFHKFFKILEPPIPLDDYLDTVLAIWSRGAVVKRGARRRTAPRKRNR